MAQNNETRGLLEGETSLGLAKVFVSQRPTQSFQWKKFTHTPKYGIGIFIRSQ